MESIIRFHVSKRSVSCKKWRISAILLTSIALNAGGALLAQPSLDFKRIEIRYPEITLAFKVTCAGKLRLDLGPQQFEVYENGILVKDATLWCPPDTTCCVSASLVFDRSGSMLGDKILKVKAGGQAYVDQMNRDGVPCDEASIVSFGSDVTIDVGMTTNKASLSAAIARMNADGRTALWDAAAVGVDMLGSANNRCRAVILLTDGGNNYSFNYLTVNAVIQHALAAGVKVFTIGYGLSRGSPDEVALQNLATATGGKYYYSATGDDIAQIYGSIRNDIQQAFRECYIKYTSNCPDGTLRTVNLVLKNFCNGSATSTKTYIAPLNRAAFTNVDIRLGTASVTATREILVPVVLETPVNGIFSAGDFTVMYDRGFAEIVGLDTQGTLLAGTPMSLEDVGSGHRIHILRHTEISGSGPLVYLKFRAGDVVYPDELELFLVNWNFEAYCLNPILHNGKLLIAPRFPELSCATDGPNTLTWNDSAKVYEPNPFQITTTIRNSGTKEAVNVRARLVVQGNGFTLLSAQQQPVSPSVILPGKEGTAIWMVQADKQDSAQTASFCVEVQADNHAELSCCTDVHIGTTLVPTLTCSISAPDTVFFREQFYDPEEFDILLSAMNTGSGLTRDVFGQLVQDTRFTITSPASISLASTLPPGASAGGSFHVVMHPRQTDGYDTVRIQVQGNDTDPAWCEHPIWVERERAPKFQLSCNAPDDSLVFSEQTSEYAPNPFTVITRAKNVGETYAEECQLLFVGPPRFTPIGTNLRPLGTMNVGDERTEQWSVRALPRTIAGWDTLHFQVLGRGGLGRRLVIADCYVPVFVPEYRQPSIRLTCDAPDSLLYVANAYVPSPFVFMLELKNEGTATAFGLRQTLLLPPTVRLEASEVAEKSVGMLVPGDSASVSWRLIANPQTSDTETRICARAIDSATISEECCTDIFVPRTADPALTADCRTVDTLYLDASSGNYFGNPFDVAATVRNLGRGRAEQVRVSIEALGSFVDVLDSTDRFAGDLDGGTSAEVHWRVRALKRPSSEAVPFRIRATASNHPTVTCATSAFIQAAEVPVLIASCRSVPEDSLLFDWSKGDYSPPETELDITVTNVGHVRASNVTVLVSIPSGIVLRPGEAAMHTLVPANLEPGMTGTSTWRVSAIRSVVDNIRAFGFLVRSDNAEDASCIDSLLVQGAPKMATLSFPRDVLLGFGEKVIVPLTVDRTIGKDLSAYDIRIVYDPRVISVLNVFNEGTLTRLGWTGAQWRIESPGVVNITDYTTSSPLHTEAGTLVSLYVEGSYRANAAGEQFGKTPLRVDSSSASLNNGEIAVRTVDGTVYVTSDCLQPLEDRATSVTNAPNPFNPGTQLTVTLADDENIRLVIVDAMGRIVRVLLEDALAKGVYSLYFDASGLPSGIYGARLETSRRTYFHLMILAQ